MSAPPAIRVVAFDLGGVLFSEGKSASRGRLAALGYDPDLIIPFLSSEEAQKLRTGQCTDAEFWNDWLRPRLPAAYDVEAIREAWYASYELDPDVAALVQELRELRDSGGRRSYVVTTFSGNIRSRVAHLEARYHFRSWFDMEVWSFDAGLNKPDPRFLRHLLERTGARAPEVFYIDDSAKDAAAAPGLGFELHLYRRGEIAALRQHMRERDVAVRA